MCSGILLRRLFFNLTLRLTGTSKGLFQSLLTWCLCLFLSPLTLNAPSLPQETKKPLENYKSHRGKRVFRVGGRNNTECIKNEGTFL